MPRLHSRPLNPVWSDLLVALFRDLEPLGHRLCFHESGGVESFTYETLDPSAREQAWERAHHLRHLTLVTARADEIKSFEADFTDHFVDMARFQPSAIQPVLEIVDFRNHAHRRIVEYLKLYQSVTMRKHVGREMGLFVWDIGQSARVPLIGAAILASPRFSQRIRDHHLGWAPDFPKTSRHHDPAARAIRVAGLARMMQLSLACALPPYHFLSGAWLAALAPFTEAGQEAFRRSVKNEDQDPDLAAVVTTTGKGISGAPFRGHRVAQLANARFEAAEGASGNVFVRAIPSAATPPLRASFEDLVSDALRQQATRTVGGPDPRLGARPRARGSGRHGELPGSTLHGSPGRVRPPRGRTRTSARASHLPQRNWSAWSRPSSPGLLKKYRPLRNARYASPSAGGDAP